MAVLDATFRRELTDGKSEVVKTALSNVAHEVAVEDALELAVEEALESAVEDVDVQFMDDIIAFVVFLL